ncbi:thiol-disulfide isomerase [Pelomonas sp. HMWF004]|nr:thiol-disulfide isomerase [Pelomonas sp. HMWF004]
MRSFRPIAAAVLIGLAAVGPVAAQVPKEKEQLKPYLQVKPVAGDEQMVRAFFTPSCPYSKFYFQFFKNLAATLPESKRFVFTPLVNKGDGVPFAVAFLAVQRYYPAYAANFVQASLEGVQERHVDVTSWAGIDAIGKAARIPVSVPRLVQQNLAQVQADLKQTLILQKRMEITNTPAVAVAGTYIVTPEFTNGDAAMFSQLVNGVISMAR